MLISILEVEVGQVFKDGAGDYMMRTDLIVGDEDYIFCVSKQGRVYRVPLKCSVEIDIPWHEQVDGYEVLYHYIRNLFPIKPQEVYDNEKGKE